MDRTPDELFGLIFEWCPTGPFPKLDPITKPEDIPILSVCRKWKRIALSTPRLWRSIRLTSAPYPTVDVITKYLALSGLCPLDMDVGHPPYPCHAFRPASLLAEPDKSSLRIIMEHTHRCQRAHWHMRWRDYFPIEEMFGQAYNLVDLHLCCETQSNSAPTNMVLALPSLKALRISGDVGLRAPLFVAPRLESLVFDHIKTNDFERIHNIIALVSTTVEFLQFKSAWIGEPGGASDFSWLSQLEFPVIQRVSVQMKTASFTAHAYFDYPAHIIRQIKTDFQLDFEGLELPSFMKKMRSNSIDRLVLTSATYPFELWDGGYVLRGDILQDKGFIYDFFENLPCLTNLYLRGFNRKITSRMSHIFRETRSSPKDKLWIVTDYKEIGFTFV
jgi:hypothetical protein